MDPTIVAQDDQGRRYALDRETCRFTVLKDAEDLRHMSPSTPQHEETLPFPIPYTRYSHPGPYGTNFSSPDELLQHTARAEFPRGDAEEAYGNLKNDPFQDTSRAARSFSDRLADLDQPTLQNLPGRPDEQSSSQKEHEFGTQDAQRKSFWRNPDGVILVYQGIDIGGKELYFGSDINYLGSFQDDNEGSSGLGSTRNSTDDLAGDGGGLAMIPEVGSSDGRWNDGALEAG